MLPQPRSRGCRSHSQSRRLLLADDRSLQIPLGNYDSANNLYLTPCLRNSAGPFVHAIVGPLQRLLATPGWKVLSERIQRERAALIKCKSEQRGTLGDELQISGPDWPTACFAGGLGRAELFFSFPFLFVWRSSNSDFCYQVPRAPQVGAVGVLS